MQKIQNQIFKSLISECKCYLEMEVHQDQLQKLEKRDLSFRLKLKLLDKEDLVRLELLEESYNPQQPLIDPQIKSTISLMQAQLIKH